MQLNTPCHFHQAITAIGMGIALLLVARRIVLGTASVGDVPMVQGAAGGIPGIRGVGDGGKAIWMDFWVLDLFLLKKFP